MAIIFLEFNITGNSINLNNADTQEQIIIPIKVHLITDTSNQYTTSKNEQYIIELLNEVNYIWSQTDIIFQLEEITITNVSFEAIPNAINSNTFELENHQNFDNKKINIFLVQSLNGLNGLAIPQINSALISDYTTVSNYRTTAHELGHILDLRHIEPQTNLMARGKHGESLSQEQIEKARNNAKKLIKELS